MLPNGKFFLWEWHYQDWRQIKRWWYYGCSTHVVTTDITLQFVARWYNTKLPHIDGKTHNPRRTTSCFWWNIQMHCTINERNHNPELQNMVPCQPGITILMKVSIIVRVILRRDTMERYRGEMLQRDTTERYCREVLQRDTTERYNKDILRRDSTDRYYGEILQRDRLRRVNMEGYTTVKGICTMVTLQPLHIYLT